MLNSILVGLIAAVIVSVPRYLQITFLNMNWYSPILLFGVGAIGLFFQKFILNRQADNNYSGLTDFIVKIHTPVDLDSKRKWYIRGLISFLITTFGGPAGPEGAAAEWTLAIQTQFRVQASRWFEQVRRLNVSTSLAASVSAAFGAPLTAVIFPTELGVGGPTIFSVVSALSGFIAVRWISRELGIDFLDVQGVSFQFHTTHSNDWLGLILVGTMGGLFGVGVTRFVKFTQDGLSYFFQSHTWVRILAASALLVAVFLIVPFSHQPSSELLEQVIWGKFSSSHIGLLLCSMLLSFALMVGGFGTVGVLWPIYALGGIAGFFVCRVVFPTDPTLSTLAALLGASAFWGAILATPVAGAVLAYELTQNLQVLFPCLVTAAIARLICKSLNAPTLVSYDLEQKGISVIQGKSKPVLYSILVKDAMVTNYEFVLENEPVSELNSKFEVSHYPFLPVINQHGMLSGLVTPEMLRVELTRKESIQSNSPLGKLMEAKDVLRRSTFKFKPVLVSDRLSDVVQLLESLPCLPVVGEDGRLVGLLLNYYVRFAYEREVARRSLSFMRETRI